MKTLSRSLFAAYLLVLLWLVLFKFSYDPVAVLRDFQTRSLNLVPFAFARRGEVLANFLAFIPFGVLLGVNFKQIGLVNRVAVILIFSLVVEVIQYVLAIGATDITDVIMNTLGGLSGVWLYQVGAKYAGEKYIDPAVLVTGTILLLGVLYLRTFVFIVRY